MKNKLIQQTRSICESRKIILFCYNFFFHFLLLVHMIKLLKVRKTMHLLSTTKKSKGKKKKRKKHSNKYVH